MGDLAGDGHARDADVIMGDNANIYRLVGMFAVPLEPNWYLRFNYDDGGPEFVIPRTYIFLDYTEGGAPTDIGDDDLIHGEDGDDTIHGMSGNDVLFGEGQDDDIYGGAGSDRIYGGTGTDGILGDDGKILTSRNGRIELLNLITVPNLQSRITLDGFLTTALIHVTGELKKQALLANWTVGGADIIYGGLGDDFLHGGAGDDAISGAEALREFYNELPQVDTDPLGYDAASRWFAWFNPNDPWSKIPGFFLNFDGYVIDEATGEVLFFAGIPIRSDDGRDMIFGDNGNDWIVGGTNGDWVFGGWGDDLMNMDDFLETNGGLNNRPEDDERFREGDFAYGGAGRDVLMANSARDRLYDWVGDFNIYVVPFEFFGSPVVNRIYLPADRRLHPGAGLRRWHGLHADPVRAVRRAGHPRAGRPGLPRPVRPAGPAVQHPGRAAGRLHVS